MFLSFWFSFDVVVVLVCCFGLLGRQGTAQGHEPFSLLRDGKFSKKGRGQLRAGPED